MTAITTIIRLRGELTEPWLIGAADTDPTVNIPALTDPFGRVPILPATTLIGALRAHLGPIMGEAWLGPEPNDETPGTPLTASRLRAAPVTVAASASDRRLITRTAIDPARGAARGRSLRLEQRVEADGSRPIGFAWVLEHAGPADRDLLTSLSTWRTRIGRGQTVGQGSMRVSDAAAYEVDLDDPAQLTWWLRGRMKTVLGAPVSAALELPAGIRAIVPDPGPAAPDPEVSRTFRWRIVDPLHIGGAAVGDVDGLDDNGDRQAQAQLVRRQPAGPDTTDRRPVIPGSTWKGIFRHRARFVLNACGVPDADSEAVIAVLFGAPGSASGRADPGRRGVLGFADSVVSGAKTPPSIRSHVAIDRISGGAADGLLFRMEGIDEGTFELRIFSPMTLSAAVDTLLHHVVLDLHEGVIGIGKATTRGYGTIALAEPEPPTGAIDTVALLTWCRTLEGNRS